MEINLNNAKDRIGFVIELEGISKRSFYRKTGMSNGVLDQKTGPSEDNLVRFFSIYPDINSAWLLTGKGSMHIGTSSTGGSIKNVVVKGSIIPKRAVPYYNLPVSAGHSVFEIEGAMKPDGYVVDLPGVGYTEGFLPVHGYSMCPEVKEGSIIGVKTADRWDHLNTQHKYLIITRDDRMVTYIKHDKERTDILWCISPNYDDFSILKEDILKVYRVTFVMNPE